MGQNATQIRFGDWELTESTNTFGTLPEMLIGVKAAAGEDIGTQYFP